MIWNKSVLIVFLLVFSQALWELLWTSPVSTSGIEIAAISHKKRASVFSDIYLSGFWGKGISQVQCKLSWWSPLEIMQNLYFIFKALIWFFWILLCIYTHVKNTWEHHTNTVFDPLSPSERLNCGIDSTRCWKHSLQMLAHIDIVVPNWH